VNSHADKLFRKWKRADWFITMSVVVQRDDGHETTVKMNDDGRWSSDGMMLWLVRRQNGDVIE
jgi:hypothetical protein